MTNRISPRLDLQIARERLWQIGISRLGKLIDGLDLDGVKALAESMGVNLDDERAWHEKD